MSIRSELIRELEQNRTKPVSGQKLAQRLHVSRNAVCKMIHTLNEEGFEIASFPRKGYQLAETSNKLSAEAISVYLKKKLPVYTFEQVDSTNQLLKKMAIDGSDTDCRGRTTCRQRQIWKTVLFSIAHRNLYEPAAADATAAV